MKKIFISSHLDNSLIRKLEQANFSVTHQSLLKIEAVDFELPKSNPDWIFFYSKNGIKFFFERAQFDPTAKYGVMGSASAFVFQEITGHRPDFIASKTGPELLSELGRLMKGSEVWAIQGQASLNFLDKIHPINELLPIVVYRNSKSTSFDLTPFTILAFSSPMNAESYFDKYKYRGEPLYAIGATTANYLKERLNSKVSYPATPGLENMIDLILRDLD